MRLLLLLAGALTASEPSTKPAEPPAAPGGVRKLSSALTADLEKKRVVIDAEVVLREGPLELLLCPRRTKEHESILAADVKPKMVQLALLMVGAKPGRPAAFEPFQPPVGQPLRVTLEYEQDGATKSVDAREWIRNQKTGKPMDARFVFAGSRFAKPPGAERAVWLGDEGDLVCVVNFPGSVVDVSMASTKENASLIFEAFTDRIPPRGTPVRLILEPIEEKAK